MAGMSIGKVKGTEAGSVLRGHPVHFIFFQTGRVSQAAVFDRFDSQWPDGYIFVKVVIHLMILSTRVFLKHGDKVRTLIQHHGYDRIR